MEGEGIKNIIFDFGGVIINITRNRCIEAFERLGVPDVREQITNNSHHKDLFMKIEVGSITIPEFHDAIRQLSVYSLTNEQIDEAWISMLGEIPDYKLDLILALHKQYNVMLLSNTNAIHWEWSVKNCFNYKGHVVSDFFRKIYLSYELCMLKPNTDIFEYVLQDARINAQETLFVDDALVNCVAAEALGMKTLHFKPGEELSLPGILL